LKPSIAARVLIESLSCAGRSSTPIRFPATCLSSAAAVEPPSGSSSFDGQGFWLATKRLSRGRFRWWPAGDEATRVLQAHQAQLLLAAGNPETEAAPVWRKVS